MANTNTSIARSKASIMPLPERSAGFNHHFHIDYGDVALGTGTTDTVTMTLGTLGVTGGAWCVSRCLVYIGTSFAGTTAFTVSVGTTSTTTAFLSANSTLTTGTISPPNGPNSINTPASSFGQSAISIVAVFTNATGGSPSALTAGALDIFLGSFDPTKLDGPILNA